MKLNLLKNKTVFISGGTGSFGKKMTHFLLNSTRVKKVIIYSRDEQKQSLLKRQYKSKRIRLFLGDVRDYDRLNFAMKEVDIVIHAAALKHVDLAEYNPFEYIKTNIIGAQNIIQTSLNHNVQRVVALSTDKASSPINLYGATKLISDKLFIAANNFKGNKKDIRFSVVRYGNVMGSRGSIIPILIEQKNKDLFTITNPDMTRFNITLTQSVNFVLHSLNEMLGGEIFIPKLDSYKLIDLVKAISEKTKIKYIGLRPGEKMHEEMISFNESKNVAEFKNYYVILQDTEYSSMNVEKYKKINNSCKRVDVNFSYSSLSNNHYLTKDKIKKLIKDNYSDFEV